MCLLINIRRIKSSAVLITALMFTLQILPLQTNKTTLPTKPKESGLSSYAIIPTISPAFSLIKDSRQNLEIKITAHDYFCRNNIATEGDINNYKKFNFGGHFTHQRFGIFLTTQFSTST